MKKFKIIKIIFGILIIAGIVLRFHNLGFNTIFDWDQENSLAYPVKEIIVNRHYPLIGPRTGIGDFRLAPLYTYLSAPFFAVWKLNPIAGAYESAVISLFSIAVSFYLIRKLFSAETAIYYSLLWSVSPVIAGLDRIPWNVNLLTLTSVFIFSGIWRVLENKKSVGWLHVGIGTILGFSSHYTVIFLLTAAFLTAIWQKKIFSREVMIFFICLILAVLPLIVFNFRHDFILSRNLALSSTLLTQAAHLYPRLIKIGSAQSEFVGRILVSDGPAWIQQTITLVLIIALFIVKRRPEVNKMIKVITPLYLVYLIGFTFYSGNVPDYYFYGLAPITILALSIVISSVIKTYKQASAVIVVLALVLLIRSFILVNQVNPQSLAAKENIVKKIKENSENKPVKVIYDMELGWSYGYKYLLDFYSVKVTDLEEKNLYWISFPAERFPLSADYKSSEIALGFPDTVAKIYGGKQLEFYGGLFKMRVSKNWVSLQCPWIDFDRYLLTDDPNASCRSLDNRTDGMLIENIPDCNIWETSGLQPLKTEARIAVYTIPADNIKAFAGRNLTDVAVLSFERSRCIGFIDLSSVSSTGSTQLKELILTLKK